MLGRQLAKKEYTESVNKKNKTQSEQAGSPAVEQGHFTL